MEKRRKRPEVATFDLFVGNLENGTTRKQIEDVFIKFGEIHQIWVKENNQEKNVTYGFVRFYYKESLDNVLANSSDITINGRRINVSEKKNKDPVNRDVPQINEKQKDLDQKSESDTSSVSGEGAGHQQSKEECVLVAHVENPITFWCQKAEQETLHQLASVQDSLASVCPSAPSGQGQPNRNKVYASKFSEDGCWYRCKVVQQFGADTIKVQYIDYGNTEEVIWSSLREIPTNLASIKPYAQKLILHNIRLKDVTDDAGKKFVKQLVEGKPLMAIRTVRLADNSGYYAHLEVNGVKVIDRLIEEGFAYSRVSMKKTSTDDGTAGRNTNMPNMQGTVRGSGTNSLLGDGKNAYHGGYVHDGMAFQYKSQNENMSGQSANKVNNFKNNVTTGGSTNNLGSNNFGGNNFGNNSFGNNNFVNNNFMGNVNSNPMMKQKNQNNCAQFFAKSSGPNSPKKQSQKLHQLSQQVVSSQQMQYDFQQLQRMNNNQRSGNPEREQALQDEVNRKKREVDKLSAEIAKKDLKLQHVMANQLKIHNVIGLTKKVRKVRQQFPTGRASGLEEAINVALSPDRITPSCLTKLPSAISNLNMYRALQTEICNCVDESELETLVANRDLEKMKLYGKLDEFISEVSEMPLESRRQVVETTLQRLKTDYKEYLQTSTHGHPSLDDMVPGFKDWKGKKEAEFKHVRDNTDEHQQNVESLLKKLSDMLRLDCETEEDTKSDPDQLEGCLKAYSQALQQELGITDMHNSGDVSFVASILTAIIKEMTGELSHLDSFNGFITEFGNMKEDIGNWLDKKPDTSEILSRKKAIRSLKNQIRHKEADRQDLEESDDSDEELRKVISDLADLRFQLHQALVQHDELLGEIARLADLQFPELYLQYQDLDLQTQIQYNGFVKSGWDIENFSLTPALKTGISRTRLMEESMYIQEYTLNDGDHLSREQFLSQLISFKNISENCEGLLPVRSVFFSKGDRKACVMSDYAELCLLKDYVIDGLDDKKRQTIARDITVALADLHKSTFIHGDVNPQNVAIRPDGSAVLLCPDLSQSLFERTRKGTVTENGLLFHCPFLPKVNQPSAGQITTRVDLYNLGLLIIYLHHPTAVIPFRNDGTPNLRMLVLDKSTVDIVYQLLSMSTIQASTVLKCGYLTRMIRDTPSSTPVSNPSSLQNTRSPTPDIQVQSPTEDSSTGNMNEVVCIPDATCVPPMTSPTQGTDTDDHSSMVEMMSPKLATINTADSSEVHVGTSDQVDPECSTVQINSTNPLLESSSEETLTGGEVYSAQMNELADCLAKLSPVSDRSGILASPGQLSDKSVMNRSNEENANTESTACHSTFMMPGDKTLSTNILNEQSSYGLHAQEEENLNIASEVELEAVASSSSCKLTEDSKMQSSAVLLCQEDTINQDLLTPVSKSSEGSTCSLYTPVLSVSERGDGSSVSYDQEAVVSSASCGADCLVSPQDDQMTSEVGVKESGDLASMLHCDVSSNKSPTNKSVAKTLAANLDMIKELTSPRSYLKTEMDSPLQRLMRGSKPDPK